MTAKGGKTVTTLTKEQEIASLLDKIDGLDPLKGQAKRAKMDDTNNEIVRIEAELVGMRRMLVQHKNPQARIDDRGTTLAAGIALFATQVERLRAYRDELNQLPDDAADEPEARSTEGGDDA